MVRQGKMTEQELLEEDIYELEEAIRLINVSIHHIATVIQYVIPGEELIKLKEIGISATNVALDLIATSEAMRIKDNFNDEFKKIRSNNDGEKYFYSSILPKAKMFAKGLELIDENGHLCK